MKKTGKKQLIRNFPFLGKLIPPEDKPVYQVAHILFIVNILSTGTSLGLYMPNPIAVKYIWLYLAIQLSTQVLHAEKGHQDNMKSREGSAELSFQSASFSNRGKDSVLVIFDRYDRSGAGVVFKVFYPAKDHTISISGIPAGKYYFTIQCMGLHRDKIEKVVRIKSRKMQTIAIKLKDCDEFNKERVVIPAERTDFSNLRIISMK